MAITVFCFFEQQQKVLDCRWKVFQCLDIEAENLGEGALRQVGPFLLDQEEWGSFLARHAAISQMVPEDNQVREYILYTTYSRALPLAPGGVGLLSSHADTRPSAKWSPRTIR